MINVGGPSDDSLVLDSHTCEISILCTSVLDLLVANSCLLRTAASYVYLIIGQDEETTVIL